jgi:L-histidine Nalpha-methyltransferase
MAQPALVPVAGTESDSHDLLAQDVRRGLQQSPKELPCRYFYDVLGCELFDAITELPEYYLTRAETEILSRYAPQIIERTKPEFIVELGAGSCTKTRLLIDAGLAGPSLRGFIPFDISRSSIDRVTSELSDIYPGLAIQGIVGDFATQLAMIPRFSHQLVMFLGSTIGNLNDDDCRLFFRTVRSLLRPDDAFLIGFDLVKDESQLLAAYNDSKGVTLRFNLNLLRRLNRELGADFDLEAFRHIAIYNRGQAQMEMYLESQKRQVVTIPGAEMRVTFGQGERIHTEISRKFTRHQVEALFVEAAMTMIGWYTDDAHRFAVALAVARES